MGKAGWIGILAFAAILGAVRAAPATPAIIAEIQAALDQGDAQHAHDEADAALKKQVSAAERGRLLLYCGLAEELLEKPDAAAGDFTQALKVRALPAQDRVQAFLQRGFLRDGQNRLDDAVADYSAVIALKTGSVATAFNNRANVYRRQNLLAEARRDYRAALAMAGGKPQYSWYGLGQIAEAQNDTLAARGFYAKAVAADSGYALASERLAALGGPPDGAIADTGTLTSHPQPAAGHGAWMPVADTSVHPPEKAPQQAANDDGVIVLHPPAAAAPKAKAGLVLRPALDAQPGAARKQVQLGAWRSEAEAQGGWAEAREKALATLEGLSPDIVVADLPGKGRYWRLRVAPGAGQSTSQLCDALAARKVVCLPVHD